MESDLSGLEFWPWSARLLTGFNRFGPVGVSFVVSWICISVSFCAPTCMFSTKGKLYTKKNRGHDRPLLLILLILWRRGRDSNPRYPCEYV